MAITADDYNALTTALSGICFALTRRPVSYTHLTLPTSDLV